MKISTKDEGETGKKEDKSQEVRDKGVRKEKGKA